MLDYSGSRGSNKRRWLMAWRVVGRRHYNEALDMILDIERMEETPSDDRQVPAQHTLLPPLLIILSPCVLLFSLLAPHHHPCSGSALFLLSFLASLTPLPSLLLLLRQR
eukprot:2047578-Rhodomonas_salina.1